MVVCQYYLRGNCKFGVACRNEHPEPRQGGFGNQSWTNPQAGASGGSYAFTIESLTRDFTEGQDKPLWLMSSYGAAKSEPTIIKDQDESPEELRWKAVQALRSGNPAEYQKYEESKVQTMTQLWRNCQSNVKDIYKEAENAHLRMSRDMQNPLGSLGLVKAAQPSTTASSSPFGKPATGAFSAFSGGGPSAFGTGANTSTSNAAFGGTPAAATSAFGKPSFGQPAFGQSSFGQPAFGQAAQKPVSAFASTQTPAVPTSAFGQPSQPASAFGQASQPQSSLIKPATAFGNSGGGAFAAFAGGGASAFGSGAGAGTSNALTSATNNTSTPIFGQSAFGSQAQKPVSAFAQAAQGAQPTSAFAPAGGSSQVTSAFGVPSTTTHTPTPSAFGTAGSSTLQPHSTFGSNQAQVGSQSAFSQPSQPTSAFGQPTQPVSVFGQSVQQQPTSVFGQPSIPQPVSVFGQPSQPQSAFGNLQQTSAGVSAFGTTASASAMAVPEKPKIGRPDFESALAVVRSKPGLDKHDGLLPPDYLDLLPSAAKDAFQSMKFELGKIPDWIPPVQFR